MPQRNRLLVWWESMSPMFRAIAGALFVPLVVLNVWAISSIFRYFNSLIVILVGASLLTFLLNYPVSYMQQHGATRGRAAIVVFLCAIAVLLGLGVTLVPLALQQAQQLVARLPEWIDSGQQQLILLNDQLEKAGFPISLDVLADQITNPIKFQLQRLAGDILGVAVVTVTSLLDVLLTLVLTFYLLQYSDRLWESLVEWLPPKIREPFTETIRLSFQNFFFGQLISSTCMGFVLTVTFLTMRVPFGLLFGLTIGTMALIPFGGSVGIAIVSVLVALRDIGLGVEVLIASLIVQQIIENLAAPRILGSVTGLNPVWVFLSILTGARVGGLLGVIVAVPTAVVIKSILVTLRLPHTPAVDVQGAESPVTIADANRTEDRQETPVS
ncbi:AI-2E family transporter [Myxacorys almedinensis]|uniref:AI-2E family transporter n=1 Tax=Myxacorys almedinensis A TaxID=2690445 RepID=A0A8J7Z9C2_9CYAN|nr:AI-2E family transporter [Myxacorys almedinensis]NDJ18823.1 AI-2E family transporter [Myxacorys almedinensis A]